jgi:hypothetical protein
MSYELQYTSAPRGLYGAASGFCTVKATRGIPLAVRELLESLSHYKHLFPPHHQLAAQNPINFSSLVASIGGKRWQVVSRIQAAGLDHTKRGNFFAHHLVLEPSVARMTCPTRIMGRTDLLLPAWDFKVEEVINGNAFPQEKEPLRPCAAWEAVSGDAGWAGAVAERLRDRQKVYVAFEPGMQTLPLISEVLCLLTGEEQAEATFSTYFAGGSQMVDCKLRFVALGSVEHREAANTQQLIDLSKRMGEATGGALVEAARSGVLRGVSAGPSERIVSEVPVRSGVHEGQAIRTHTAAAATVPRVSSGARSVQPRVALPLADSLEQEFPQYNKTSNWWLAPASALGGIVLALLITLPIAFWLRAQLLVSEGKVSDLENRNAALNSDRETSEEMVKRTTATLADEKARYEGYQKDADDKSRAVEVQHRAKERQLKGEIAMRDDQLKAERAALAEARAVTGRLEADVERLEAEKKELSARLRKALGLTDPPDDGG